MLLPDLRRVVFEANLELVRQGLVSGTPLSAHFRNLDYSSIPAVLVANHGAFTWGPDPATSAHNAVILEFVARIAYFTLGINSQAGAIGRALHDKHFLRKHGKDAYYGQPKEKK
jgi:L-ribulose-5-phosphate 4-epimerase